MNILIDMDGVICTEEKTFERALAKPIPGAKEAIDALKAEGHQLIIYTARSWAELAMTKAWLEKHKIQYDGVHMGKPVADCFVDDRAIAYTGWPATLEALSHNGKPDVDQEYLRILRQATANFLHKIVVDKRLKGPVLEVGPMTRQGLNSPVYSFFPESYVDTRTLIEDRGLKYISLDLDITANPDIVSDFMNIEKYLESNSLGEVIMLSCLEHMPRLFEVPLILNKILKPGGLVFLLTPWNFRFHGPRPDCWRISDDGYEALFAEHFTIETLYKIPCPGRPLSPVGMQCVLRKKA